MNLRIDDHITPAYNQGMEGSSRTNQKGKEVMQELGEALVDRYEVLFKRLVQMQKDIDVTWTETVGEKPRVIQVTAIDKEIARSSADEIISGMQREGKEIGLNTDNIARSNKNIDKTAYIDPLRLNEPEKGSCESFEIIMKDLKTKSKSSILNSKNNTGKDKEVNDKDVCLQYERLQMEFVESRELPTTRKSILKEMRKSCTRRMTELIGDDIKYWKFFVSPMLNSIFEEFKLPKRPSPTGEQLLERQSRLHIHVVDAHLMAALVWWLRLEGQLSRDFLKGEPDFYPQVGNSLIIDIDDNAMFQVAYMSAVESVEQAQNEVWFKPLSLEPKCKQDFLDIASTYKGVAWSWFYSNLFKNELELRACCESHLCR